MWGREDCNRRTRGLYVNIQTRPTSSPQLYMNGNRGPLCKEFGILCGPRCKITQAEILPKLRLKNVLRRIISVEPDVCFSLQLKQQGMFSKSLHLFGDCEMIRLGSEVVSRNLQNASRHSVNDRRWEGGEVKRGKWSNLPRCETDLQKGKQQWS